MRKKHVAEMGMKGVFLLASVISIAAFLVICYFIFKSGVPFLAKYGLGNFLFGKDWHPVNVPPAFGIFPMIYGSVVITALACIVGVPLGIFSAIFLTWEISDRMHKIVKPMLNLMAGIPSIVYGFFALQVLVPFVKNLFGGTGLSMLTAGLLLGIMILPTIVAISEAAIRAVPRSYYEASMALGAGHARSVMKVVLPAAKSGVLAAVILGVGRAIGETMAVNMVAGNQARVSFDLTKGILTMTTNVVTEMGYAAGEHRSALLATGCVLFVFILLINGAFLFFKKRGAKHA